jgi:hypothetical protein
MDGGHSPTTANQFIYNYCRKFERNACTARKHSVSFERKQMLASKHESASHLKHSDTHEAFGKFLLALPFRIDSPFGARSVTAMIAIIQANARFERFVAKPEIE